MKKAALKIKIAEPCHEDWSNMQPGKQGRYCLSCSKSVVDFTGKTETEIIQILKSSSEQKICGRFKASQISSPLIFTVDLNSLPLNMNAGRIFAVSLLIAFGTSLVSCYDHHKHKIEKIEWKSSEQNAKTKETEKSKNINKLPEMGVYSFEGSGLLKQLSPSGEKSEEKSAETQSDELKDSSTNNLSVRSDSIIHFKPPENPMVQSIEFIQLETMVMGAIAVEIFEPGDRFITDCIFGPAQAEEIPGPEMKVDENLVVFPNIARENFVVRYGLFQKSDVRIDLLSESGSLVKTILEMQEQDEGNYEIPVNAGILPRGIYFVSRLVNGRRENKKIIIGD